MTGSRIAHMYMNGNDDDNVLESIVYTYKMLCVSMCMRANEKDRLQEWVRGIKSGEFHIEMSFRHNATLSIESVETPNFINKYKRTESEMNKWYENDNECEQVFVCARIYVCPYPLAPLLLKTEAETVGRCLNYWRII